MPINDELIMNSPTQLPLVILTGHRKSGTSLFHRLFDGHPGITLYPVDISLLYAYFPCFTDKYSHDNEVLKERLLHVINKSFSSIKNNQSMATSYKTFIEILHQSMDKINLTDMASVIQAVTEAWSQHLGKNINSQPFIFKETSQSIFFNEFKNSFPALKMISIIRDPRDNFAAIHSGIDQYYSTLGEDALASISSHINRARMDLISTKSNMQNHPESFLAIKFEDLVTRPEDIMKQVAKFLNIDFDQGLISPEIAGEHYHGNSHEGKIFSGISSENVGSWKTRIPEQYTKIIEYWMQDAMKIWQYKFQFSEESSQQEFAKFYSQYNCKYFYHDSFK